MLAIILLIILATALIILVSVVRRGGCMNCGNNQQVEHFYFNNCIGDVFGGMRCYPYEENETRRYFKSLLPHPLFEQVNSV
ncbi:MAG: hypothetical protein Terrestrivirus2_18 [Terrestrivirus sp.]|uniref:Uncharacterized protein n=1 Tax=Terrestrivirus sp. TaxID=2487775 RepID=A0A3G4ZKY9_9VIRU|nr:MAG: hypothetical protein Terrestrivirus2_18 [Terrestrivirus sp.]